MRKLRLRKALCPRQPQQVSGRPGTWSRGSHPSTHVLIKHNAQRMGAQGAWAPMAGGSQEASLAEGRRGGTEDHEEPECRGQDGEVGFLPWGKEPPILQQATGRDRSFQGAVREDPTQSPGSHRRVWLREPGGAGRFLPKKAGFLHRSPADSSEWVAAPRLGSTPSFRRGARNESSSL